MNSDARIYIAGHTGCIGASITRLLTREGYRNLLLKSHQELDLENQGAVDDFFRAASPEYVVMCAGKVGGISANSRYPADFISRNAAMTFNAVNSSFKYHVKKLLYLGCSCIYPKHCPQPMKEEYLLTGSIEPTNEPYALAKILGVKMCESFNRQHKTCFIPIVAGNVYGPGMKHWGEDAHVIASLLRRFMEADRNHADTVTIWGSGTPTRDFLFVDDLAEACLFLLRRDDEPKIINIGSGRDTSIADLASQIKEITGFRGTISFDRSRPDGMLKRVLDNSGMASLGWKAGTDLTTGLQRTHDWYRKSLAQ